MKVIKHKDKWYLQSETGYKEILLSTDTELTLDGVQHIDDEFLEWFVKNPSCEEVEVIYGLYNPMGRKVSNEKVSENHSQCVWKYKIIIPKEEQKQHLIDMMKDDEELGLYEEPKQENCCTPIGQIKRYIDCKGCSKKPKQETLEEAMERLSNIVGVGGITDKHAFMLGTFWQQERSYSEEEAGELVYNIIGEYGKHYGIMIDGAKLNDLFEQFKKEIK